MERRHGVSFQCHLPLFSSVSTYTLPHKPAYEVKTSFYSLLSQMTSPKLYKKRLQIQPKLSSTKQAFNPWMGVILRRARVIFFKLLIFFFCSGLWIYSIQLGTKDERLLQIRFYQKGSFHRKCILGPQEEYFKSQISLGHIIIMGKLPMYH